jgi:uncharacterized protein YbjT (DUF2867 family)
MRTCVVAGATGRVGSVVARQLLAAGATPRVIVRSAATAREWQDRGADVAVGSLGDSGFLAGVLRGADGFFTLLPESVPPDEFHAARRGMADAIAAAVGASGVRRVVMLSAIAAALPDGSGPASDLHYCENALRATGAPTAALRACYFQDNVAGVLPVAAQNGVYPNLLGDADREFPMIATADVGQFAAEALTATAPIDEPIDLLGPRYSIRQVAAKLGLALGSPVEPVDVPSAEHVPALVRAGVPAPLARILAEMFAAFAAGRIAPAAARQMTGTTPIDQVIRECLDRSRAMPQA